jgi:predicted nucleotidyltransferase
MDAAPLLEALASLIHRHALEAVMVGNAAAAIQGAPITTLDIDFFIRGTQLNEKKLKAIAKDLDATLTQPFYPACNVFRMERNRGRVQVDFLSEISGVRSFEGLRRRATKVDFGGAPLMVASLADIIKSKKAAGRPQDIAALPILEESLAEKALDEERTTRTPEEGV